ncbi:hypothetical protein RUM44_011994 [Polyplax serrata]|uniref:Cystatin domain-containing protein n=1 Tax=Polyplax serrata TaxID=468196 RepID=A0ABR1BA22_POLSC
MKVVALVFFLTCLSWNVQGVNVEGVNVVGAPRPAEKTDPQVIRMSEIALEHLNKQKKEGEAKYELLEILDPTIQLVQGTLTKFKLKVRENSNEQYCNMAVLEGIGGNIEVQESECKPAM